MAQKLQQANPDLFVKPKKFVADVFGYKCTTADVVDWYDDGKCDFIKNSSVYDGQAIIIETIVQKLQQVLEALSSSEIPDYNFLESTSKLVDCATECATLI